MGAISFSLRQGHLWSIGICWLLSPCSGKMASLLLTIMGATGGVLLAALCLWNLCCYTESRSVDFSLKTSSQLSPGMQVHPVFLIPSLNKNQLVFSYSRILEFSNLSVILEWHILCFKLWFSKIGWILLLCWIQFPHWYLWTTLNIFANNLSVIFIPRLNSNDFFP